MTLKDAIINVQSLIEEVSLEPKYIQALSILLYEIEKKSNNSYPTYPEGVRGDFERLKSPLTNPLYDSTPYNPILPYKAGDIICNSELSTLCSDKNRSFTIKEE